MNKVLGHFRTICNHKRLVFTLMRKCGKGWQGFWHDMSKFSPTEFVESVKYYCGTQSPINIARDAQGYSRAWLHHRGVNKHHNQYWVDLSFGIITCAEMPWKYLLEFICDGVAAGITYSKNAGTEWKQTNPLNYYLTKDKDSYFHENTRKKIEFYYQYIADYGLDSFCSKVKNEGDFYESFTQA